MLDAGRPRAQRGPGRLGRPGARRDQLVEGRVTGPGARPPLPGLDRARPPGDGGLPDHVLARRRRKRSAARRMADPAAVLPPATGTALAAPRRMRKTLRSSDVMRHGPKEVTMSSDEAVPISWVTGRAELSG